MLTFIPEAHRDVALGWVVKSLRVCQNMAEGDSQAAEGDLQNMAASSLSEFVKIWPRESDEAAKEAEEEEPCFALTDVELDDEDEIDGGEIDGAPCSGAAAAVPLGVAGSSAQGAASAAAGAAVPATVLMCLLCGLHPRKAKAIFCAHGCEADIRGAARDAKAQGPNQLKAFSAIRRGGGEAFAEAIRLYKSKCQGSGRGWRRPRFAWVKYQMLIETRSEMQWGSKSVYVSKSSFIKMKMQDDDLTQEAATQEWMNQMEAAKGTNRIHQDGKRLLVLLEEFVITFDSKSKADNLLMGENEKKAPNDQDVLERQTWMATDHEEFDTDFYSSASGISADMLKQHRRNTFATSSLPSKEQEQEEKQKADEIIAATKSQPSSQKVKVKKV